LKHPRPPEVQEVSTSALMPTALSPLGTTDEQESLTGCTLGAVADEVGVGEASDTVCVGDGVGEGTVVVPGVVIVVVGADDGVEEVDVGVVVDGIDVVVGVAVGVTVSVAVGVGVGVVIGVAVGVGVANAEVEEVV
jgi:hypothetical protein